MIRIRVARHALGVALIVLGGALMWAAMSPLLGSLLFATAIALEAAGIWLEHRNNGE